MRDGADQMASEFVFHLEKAIETLEADLKTNPDFVLWQSLGKTLDDHRNRFARAPAPSVERKTDHLAPVKSLADRETGEIGTKKIREVVADWIKGRSEPTPTREIFDYLNEIKLSIPGENPFNNLSAILSNSKAFVSYGRSGWRMASDIQRELQKELDVASISFNSLTQEQTDIVRKLRDSEAIPPDIDKLILQIGREVFKRHMIDDEAQSIRSKVRELVARRETGEGAPDFEKSDSGGSESSESE